MAETQIYHPAVLGFIASRAAGGVEKRERISQTHPKDPVLAKWFGVQNATEAGVYVDEAKALAISTVYACVKVLSESIAILPFQLRRGDEEESVVARDYYLFNLLRKRPNKWQTPIEYLQMLAAHVVLRGAAYSRILSGASGRIEQLIPLHPDRVTPFMAPDGTRCYTYLPPSGAKQILLQDEVFYIPGLTDDGVRPLSVIAYAKETIGLAYATQQYGARYFKNNASPGGIMQHPGKMGDDAYSRLKSDWEARHQGSANAHRIAILEEGMTYASIGMTAQDAQFVESRKISPIEICQYFGVPPHLVQILDRSTNNNIEQQSLDFILHCLLPWLTKFEQAADRDLLQTKSEQNNMFYKFCLEEMLKGDTATRTAYYSGGLQNGWLSRNEVRLAEGRKPFPGGDEYMIQMNMGQGGADKDRKSEKKPVVKKDEEEETEK